MTKETIQQQLPSSLALPEELREADSQFRAELRVAQDAFCKLQAMPDYLMPDTLSGITIAHLDALTHERKQQLSESYFLTAEIKTQLSQEWQKFHKQASTLINRVRAFLDTHTEFTFYIDEATGNIAPQGDVLATIKKKLTKTTPPLAHEHWKRVHEALQAVEDLRAWEQANSIRKMRLIELCHYDAKRFAEGWIAGDFLMQEETPTQKVTREYFERQYV